ncbi:MAG: hypothetical protein H3Z51_08265 [archaeon]|nr:hypothetical protein [archaeon]
MDDLLINENIKFEGVITENKFTKFQIHSPSHKKLLPQLEVPFKRYRIKPSKPSKKEGLNSLYKASAILWLLLCHRYPSLRINTTFRFVKEAIRRYRYKLYNLSYESKCLDYFSMVDLGYMKEKHWVYATYMATMSSLPISYKTCNAQEILGAILAKTSLGTGTKLLDNLNDEIHDVSHAFESLDNMLSAYAEGAYKSVRKDTHNTVTGAENSAFEMGRWVFTTLKPCQIYAPEAYSTYIKDVMKLYQGQLDSIRHKMAQKDIPSIRRYLDSISEKSIGDIWIDIDLCFLEGNLGGFSKDESRAINLLKIGSSLVFKSSLIYDDVQDIYEDLSTNSINSAIILAIERGVISQRDLKEKSQNEIFKRMREEGILMKTIKLADMVFLKGIEMVNSIGSSLDEILDKKGLIQGFRFVRLFNLRKLLIRKKNYENIKLFLSSLEDFEKIKMNISDDIMALQRYLD